MTSYRASGTVSLHSAHHGLSLYYGTCCVCTTFVPHLMRRVIAVKHCGQWSGPRFAQYLASPARPVEDPLLKPWVIAVLRLCLLNT
jgi:hypothetical protein